MFEPASRYAELETVRHQDARGRVVAYKARRFLPRSDTLPLLAEVAVADGDRLDAIAARTLGDPEQFWQVCDANDAMHPAALLEEPGGTLRIPVPAPRA